MAEKQQRLVLAVIDFLNTAISNGTVKSDDAEGIEVAVQCIGEAFGVDPSNQAQVDRLSVKPATLQSIFDVYIKTVDKVGANEPSTSKPKATSAVDKVAAEKFKAAGNASMSAKKYDEAIKAYSEAIDIDPTNAIYYSNRAAAYSSSGDHLSAVGDAEKSISVDSSFVKAYHRLGHAQYCLGDFKAAADAFGRGLELEPSNAGLKTGLDNSKARIVDDDDVIPDNAAAAPSGGSLDGMADMFKGLGGAGGGMPDLSSIMGNPQVRAMAEQMAANGGLERMMSNPAVASMMGRVQSGNMPSMSELMNDPEMRNLASQFMGPGAGRQ